jgi:hypothetical protein
LVPKYLVSLGAGNAFCQAAQIQLHQLANKHEAATHYIDAANCYKKSDNDGKSARVLLVICSDCHLSALSPNIFMYSHF